MERPLTEHIRPGEEPLDIKGYEQDTRLAMPRHIVGKRTDGLPDSLRVRSTHRSTFPRNDGHH